MTDFVTALTALLGAEQVTTQAPLAPLTTFKVGGPADVLAEPRRAEHVAAALQLAHRHGVPVTLLGGGSNVVIADAGVRGLVLRPRGGSIGPVGADLVRADAPITVNGLVRWTIGHGYAGLHAWAGTPGTVGGAIHGNAHWKGANIGEYVESVRLARPDGTLLQVPAERMDFGYDRSRLQVTREIVLWVAFRLAPGHEPDALRAEARASLSFRKGTQPLDRASAGCIFQNPQRGQDAVPDGIPWSAGALVDRAGLKGEAIGGARVSPTHGNFIVNDGRATAAEIRALVERCRTRVHDAFGVRLRDEIVFLGDFAPPSP